MGPLINLTTPRIVEARRRQSGERELTTTPDIGFHSASDYLEYLVLPAFADFSKTPKRTSAVKFAVAAWHLHDRLWHERGKPDRQKFVAGLIASCPELGLVRELADAAKHHRLDRPSVSLTRLEGREGGGVLESFGPLGMTSSVDRGSLILVEADGSRHDPLTVFRRVVDFWRSELTKQVP
jgi:hypothetical protein